MMQIFSTKKILQSRIVAIKLLFLKVMLITLIQYKMYKRIIKWVGSLVF